MQVEVVAQQLCAPIPGGTGRYTAELVAGLARTAPTGAVLTAIAARTCSATTTLAAHGIQVRPLGIPGPLLARLWERGLPPRLGSGGRGRQPALVHAPTLLVPPVPARSPLVVTIHDVVPWTHPETLTPRGVAFHRRMGARAARRADLVITPTEAVADRVREILRPCGPVRAIPLGSTPLVLPPDPEAERRRHGVGGRPYVLFVGTAEPRKGLDVLVRAMAEPALADLDLVIVGPQGWGDVDLADLATRAGLTARTHCVGRVDDGALAALQAGAAALAMPSRAEGFGIPVIEAMALGTPVVTSDDPALLETGAGHAWTAPVGDARALAAALVRATTEGPERERRRAAGRFHAAALTWDRAAGATWEAYEDARGHAAARSAQTRR